MVIKNTTVCDKNICRQAAMMINSKDEKYRRCKLAFNGIGLVFGIVAVSIVSRQLMSTGDYNIWAVLPFLLVCGVCLYVGMYYLDRNKCNRIRAEYAEKGIERIDFEIDSEEIAVISGQKKCVVPWTGIRKWLEDVGNFYLLMDETQEAENIHDLIAGNTIIISKKGFTQCSSRDMKQLCGAVMEARRQPR
jgi:hypothetical protein